ncbi:MAG: hypothetical protein HY823_05560 [Acidobacteria bacterium]|nr:hypothetical protein [Acidobacteriota bacterium]
MRLPARIAALLTGTVAAACFAAAVKGLRSLGQFTDPALRSDAKGFVAFWAFLGCIFLAIGAASWWLTRSEEG